MEKTKNIDSNKSTYFTTYALQPSLDIVGFRYIQLFTHILLCKLKIS